MKKIMLINVSTLHHVFAKLCYAHAIIHFITMKGLPMNRAFRVYIGLDLRNSCLKIIFLTLMLHYNNIFVIQSISDVEKS